MPHVATYFVAGARVVGSAINLLDGFPNVWSQPKRVWGIEMALHRRCSENRIELREGIGVVMSCQELSEVTSGELILARPFMLRNICSFACILRVSMGDINAE